MSPLTLKSSPDTSPPTDTLPSALKFLVVNCPFIVISLPDISSDVTFPVIAKSLSVLISPLTFPLITD